MTILEPPRDRRPQLPRAARRGHRPHPGAQPGVAQLQRRRSRHDAAPAVGLHVGEPALPGPAYPRPGPRSHSSSCLGIDVPPATAARGIVAFDFPKGRLEMTNDRSRPGSARGSGAVPHDDRPDCGPGRGPRLHQAPGSGRGGLRRAVRAAVRQLPRRPAATFAYYASRTGRVVDDRRGPARPGGDRRRCGLAGGAGSPPRGGRRRARAARRQSPHPRRRPRRDLGQGRAPTGGSAAATSTEAFEFHLPDTSVALPAAATGRVPTYRPIETRTDTNVLVEPGVIDLLLPASEQLDYWTDLDPLESGVGGFPPMLEGTDFERLITWIRVRPAGGEQNDIAGRRSARLAWIGANAALVEQRTRVVRRAGRHRNRPARPAVSPGEHAGAARHRRDHRRRRRLAASRRPHAGGTRDTKRRTERAVGYQRRTRTCRPRVVRSRRATGDVIFGDGLHGARPPKGAAIVASYDTGGGRQGLIGTGSIAKALFLPAGANVTNPLPTWGGDRRPDDSAGRALDRRIRAASRPAWWRRPTSKTSPARPRASTSDASRRCRWCTRTFPGQQLPGVVTLLLIPLHDPVSPDAPTPDQYFLRAVCDYVEDRRLLTTELHLRGPVYVPVWASIGIDVMPGRAVGPVREAVKAAVRAFCRR